MTRKTPTQVRGETLLREQGCTDATSGEQDDLFGTKAGIAASVNTKPSAYDIQGRGTKVGRGPIVDFKLPSGDFCEVKFGMEAPSSIAWSTGTSTHLNAVILGLAVTRSKVWTAIYTEIGEGLYRREVYDSSVVAKAAIAGLVGEQVPVGDLDPVTGERGEQGSIPWAGFKKGTAPLQTIGYTTQKSKRMQAVDAQGSLMTITVTGAKGKRIYVKGQGYVRVPKQDPVWAIDDEGNIRYHKRTYGMWRHNLSMLRAMGEVTTTMVREDDLLADWPE
jgi:hypothetical protein